MFRGVNCILHWVINKISVLEFDFQNAFMRMGRCLEVDVDVHS